MPESPLYPKIVAGYEDNERGADAAALAEMLTRSAGEEMRRVHIDSGSPGRGLRKLAEAGEADLIALGSTHRAAIGSIAPGSVAQHLLSGAPCRLAIAPRGYARAMAVLSSEAAGLEADDVPQGSPMPFVREVPRVIAVGFDGTPGARAALEEASELARRSGAAMRVISVSAPPTPTLGPAATVGTVAASRDVSGDLQQTLHDAIAELPPELRALPVHERGDPSTELIEQSGEGVDLLVLGSRGFGPVLRLMLGSVAARVIRRAQCPVMVVPQGVQGTGR